MFVSLALVPGGGSAQTTPAENTKLNKKACDYLTQAEAEAIAGTPLQPAEQNPFQCRFVSVGFTNKPPNNKQVKLEAWGEENSVRNHFRR